MLEAVGLSRAFGAHRAVDGVSIRIAEGAITGLIGPNGAGKTTLFNLLSGALRPTGGRMLLDGRRIDGLPAHRIFARGVVRTFQIPRPFPDMTVLENVMVAPGGQAGERVWTAWTRPRAVAAAERRLRGQAMEWLAFLSLDRLAEQPAGSLSGGQRKLLELARALMADPRLILLDEPGAGVNPALLELIMTKIRALNEAGRSFLIIEHNMDLVMSLCRPILVMAEGRLLMEGTAAEVRADPRVIDAYLGGPQPKLS